MTDDATKSSQGSDKPTDEELLGLGKRKRDVESETIKKRLRKV
jgi:hypothetical protein